jgi:predicted ATP-dependent endonuclease of OLD family
MPKLKGGKNSMYIQKISLRNYRNFNDFTMKFRKGLNVIIGSNNSGKTGLLYAIRLLNNSAPITVHDFNKNNILEYAKKYCEDAPRIEVEYEIKHQISEDDTEDESIIKLVPFLGMKEIEQSRQENGDNATYSLTAIVKLVFSLQTKALAEYRNALVDVRTADEYLSMLETFIDRYEWSYTNGASDTPADKKDVIGIFDIRFIEAERTSENVSKETKREIEAFTRNEENIQSIRDLKQKLSEDLKDILKPVLERMSSLFENEQNEIGLQQGNVSIFQNLRHDIRVSDAYLTDVKDTKGEFVVPLAYNGLGYNNLINIYMLIKLTEIRKGKDFRILCLEEPEAHLHPAMQYKLFKFLRKLDEDNKLNQQIFVTTHSSNISAVAGLDNMFMLSYCRSDQVSECCQQSLEEHFSDKEDSKRHLAKFLDVTRSDMLFADKIILVEGIAEKLLLPLFMEKCNFSYEDYHISIIEIGGKHFEHFIELFNGNAVTKKVLCITDCDFPWIEDNILKSISEYTQREDATHIKKLKKIFTIDNFHLVSQSLGGQTFEDELFLENIGNVEVTKSLLKIVLPDCMLDFLNTHNLCFDQWAANLDKISNAKTKKKISDMISIFQEKISIDSKFTSKYHHLFFAQLFLSYAKSKKGDVALGILTSEEIVNQMSVITYIKEGLEWLSK